MPDISKNKRSSFATFLNVAPSATSPSWKREGKGITSQTVNYNPSSDSEQYIDEDNATTTLNAYAPTMDGAMTTYKGDPVFDFVDGLRQARAIGSDAETDLLMVYLYDFTESQSVKTYKAEKQRVCIQIDDFGGEAGAALPINFTHNFMGDPVKGTVTITAGVPTFTADT